MYRITKIENNGSGAQPFTFGQHKVVTSSPIRFSKDPSNNEEPGTAAQLLGDKLVDNMQVPPGKVANAPGCFIKTVRSNNANTLASTLVGLTYQSDPGQAAQTVKMHREPSNNVTSTVTQATAVSLRSLC